MEFDFALLKRMLVFGFPLHINHILTFVFQRMDTIIIGGLLGPIQVAFYEVARQIPDSLDDFYQAFQQVFFPFMAKFLNLGENRKAAKMLNQSTRWLTVVTVFGTLLAAVFGKEIISLLFSERYLASAPVFTWLMLALSFTLIDYTLGYSLVAVGESNKPPLINVVRAIACLTGYIVLIPNMGIVGAAIATLLSILLVNPANVFFLSRKQITVDIGAYLKPVLIFGLCAAIFYIWIPTGLLERVSILVLFAVIAVAWSVVTREDFDYVSREFRRVVARLRSKQLEANAERGNTLRTDGALATSAVESIPQRLDP